jgi:hypothetical protein
MRDLQASELDEVLSAVGDLLAAQGERVGIIVVGGASLSLSGIVKRTTGDVDVLALVHPEDSPGDEGSTTLVPPDPFPEPLAEAIQRVARDYQLPSDWMNAAAGKQWHSGLPPYLREDMTWKTYGGL